MAVQGIDLGKYKLGWHDTETSVFKPKKGLNEEIVREISGRKEEPEWMTKFRLNALKRFERKPMLAVVREEHARPSTSTTSTTTSSRPRVRSTTGTCSRKR